MTQSELKYLRYYLQNEPDILLFTKLMFKQVYKRDFLINWHHKVIADKLNSVLRYDHPTNCLIFNIPPRHTKTELAVINLATYGFSINPYSEIMHLSASDELVRRNIINMRQIMNCELFTSLFPEITLSDSGSGKMTTSQGGVLYSAPFLGQITGFGCGKLQSDKFSGAMLIDDPIKTQDALSEAIREKVNFAWANTLISRKNDERTPVIVTAQRTHQHDFCGFLLEKEGTIEEGGKWDLIKFPAIINENTDEEQALWSERIGIESLRKQRDIDKWVFETQYQQNPLPDGYVLFPEDSIKLFDTILPLYEYDYIHCQIDPAAGGDHLCAVIYGLKDRKIFTLDMVYSRQDADVTLQMIMKLLWKYKPASVLVETNIAWKLYYQMLQKEINENIKGIQIGSFQSSGEKEARIANTAPIVRELFHYLLKGLRHKEYEDAMRDKHRYIRAVKNQDDDFLDVESCAVNFFKVNGFI